MLLPRNGIKCVLDVCIGWFASCLNHKLMGQADNGGMPGQGTMFYTDLIPAIRLDYADFTIRNLNDVVSVFPFNRKTRRLGKGHTANQLPVLNNIRVRSGGWARKQAPDTEADKRQYGQKRNPGPR